MHCVTMNACRAECVTELGPNNSEPERARAHTMHSPVINKRDCQFDLVFGGSGVILDHFVKKMTKFFYGECIFLFFVVPKKLQKIKKNDGANPIALRKIVFEIFDFLKF